jgi:hypothetical protein
LTAPGRKERRTLVVAERVHDLLLSQGIETAVIGAMALAVHGYVRTTRDFDLASHTEPFLKLRVRKTKRAQAAARLRPEIPC